MQLGPNVRSGNYESICRVYAEEVAEGAGSHHGSSTLGALLSAFSYLETEIKGYISKGGAVLLAEDLSNEKSVGNIRSESEESHIYEWIIVRDKDGLETLTEIRVLCIPREGDVMCCFDIPGVVPKVVAYQASFLRCFVQMKQLLRDALAIIIAQGNEILNEDGNEAYNVVKLLRE